MNCYINSKVKSAMQAEGLTKFPHETGGLLLGYRTETSYVITAMIGPGPRATHELLNFKPDSNWQQLTSKTFGTTTIRFVI